MLDFDFSQGTIWYSVFKYKPILEVARLMDYKAMGVGNHEFDDGRNVLLPFAQESGFPLLAANLNVSAFPEIDA
jgi:5'-nucleotidase